MQEPEKEKKRTHRWSVGEHDEQPEIVSLCGTHLRLIARFTLVAAYSGRRRSCSSRERTRDVGLATSLISKMRSSLSMRGMIRRWWRLAKIEAAPSPASARLRSALVSNSNRY
jgi:hypothetical protein